MSLAGFRRERGRHFEGKANQVSDHVCCSRLACCMRCPMAQGCGVWSGSVAACIVLLSRHGLVAALIALSLHKVELVIRLRPMLVSRAGQAPAAH